jgi:uncharacterized protein (TIGR02328 family)
MRLWHQSLISKLPDSQLRGQHRELCAMRGKGWGVKHSVVNYVWGHPYTDLFNFHLLVMDEMRYNRTKKNGDAYTVDSKWFLPTYRGKRIGWDYSDFTKYVPVSPHEKIYAEHDDQYLQECLNNLKGKGIIIQ